MILVWRKYMYLILNKDYKKSIRKRFPEEQCHAFHHMAEIQHIHFSDRTHPNLLRPTSWLLDVCMLWFHSSHTLWRRHITYRLAGAAVVNCDTNSKRRLLGETCLLSGAIWWEESVEDCVKRKCCEGDVIWNRLTGLEQLLRFLFIIDSSLEYMNN